MLARCGVPPLLCIGTARDVVGWVTDTGVGRGSSVLGGLRHGGWSGGCDGGCWGG